MNFVSVYRICNVNTNLTIIPDDISDEAVCYTTDMMSTDSKALKNADIILVRSTVVFGLSAVGQKVLKIKT